MALFVAQSDFEFTDKSKKYQFNQAQKIVDRTAVDLRRLEFGSKLVVRSKSNLELQVFAGKNYVNYTTNTQ